MAIGIGLHCMYCDHGPCNGECNAYESADIHLDKEDEIKEIFQWLANKGYLYNPQDCEIIYNQFMKEKNNRQ